jgi:hypothetical protein
MKYVRYLNILIKVLIIPIALFNVLLGLIGILKINPDYMFVSVPDKSLTQNITDIAFLLCGLLLLYFSITQKYFPRLLWTIMLISYIIEVVFFFTLDLHSATVSGLIFWVSPLIITAVFIYLTYKSINKRSI